MRIEIPVRYTHLYLQCQPVNDVILARFLCRKHMFMKVANELII